MLVGWLALAGAALAADDEKKETDQKPATDAVDRYAVPDGDVSELVKFMTDLAKMRPTSREEFMEMRAKQPAALRKAAEKILALEKDETSAAHQAAKKQLLQLDIQSLAGASPEAAGEIFKRVTAMLDATQELSRNELSIAFSTASTLERSGKRELALEAYNTFGEIFKSATDEALKGYGEKMLGSARRMNLLGNEMEVTGKLLDGGQFNWKTYRGKVVLVDFWATWCGPCIAELPNVQKAYKLYHDKGFDVVGISLDTDRQRLEKFLEERELPWVCLFEDGAGWDHPMANYYGIMGIPTVILVDQQGKVVSLQARGPALMSELEKLLGPPAKEEQEEPQAEEASS
jgi:thiol-disulfide isomerase/thioredoxin